MIFIVKIGCSLSTPPEVIDPDEEYVLPAQVEAILAIHKERPSAWWCNNPFDPATDGNDLVLNGEGILHSFYDLEGRLCVFLISSEGLIVKSLISPPDLQSTVGVVASKFGAFQGQCQN